MQPSNLVTEDDGTEDIIFPASDTDGLVYPLTRGMFLNKEEFERQQFVQWLGSFPMHDDDRGPHNVVLIDLMPAGDDFGETSLKRITDAIVARFVNDKTIEIGARSIDPATFREYDAEFQKHPRGVSFGMMELYGKVEEARRASRACIMAVLGALLAGPSSHGARARSSQPVTASGAPGAQAPAQRLPE